ncbi:sensor histidine kinase [Fructilactobacillus cliffordii]|uniref:histidine kinase n=1 Tax=Fructilactobacillus cliffordii TaxID=2940299 RepID=A0A9Q8ZSW6_9LACO|nr:HAMP domain-containing sensor histidine kinase [Fructilactobacillus cliffordii]USS87200.1 HAMP domain-containing histidine kinase [Fructilactobacillus cliffordii]USS89937.1 HAMP domain-containing histidine kinase [Fructilactobacillus cliffordii]
MTIVLLLLANIAIGNILTNFIRTNQGVTDGIFIIKQSITFGPWHQHFLSWEGLFWILMLLFDAVVVWWRIIRVYRRIQISRIIDELHYISDGHFDHRIPFRLTGDNERVVNSVNTLVDNVIQSLEEERRIEKSKDDLVTSVSHDLRTPLTSIIGYLGLIEDHQYQNEAELRKYCHIAYQKAQQMKKLVDRLFEYTKANNIGEQRLEINQIDVNQLLAQLETSFALEAQKRGMEIRVRPLEMDVTMSANAEMLGRVFNNLIMNALKYGNDGHQIWLTANQEDPTTVTFQVANDGKSIPKKVIHKIFDRFYREELSRNVETGGSGLGLAIVREIINNQGGTIQAESNSKWTTFTFTLPLKLTPQTS